MNKKYISGLLIFGVFAAIIAFYFSGNPSATKTLEIEFVSDHAIAKEGENLPAEISIFSSVFEIQAEKTNYYPLISFGRVDVSVPITHISYSKTISTELSLDEVSKIYLDETPFIKASKSMVEPSGNEKLAVNSDTSKIRTFFLIPSEDSRKDDVRYFDNASKLKKHILKQLEDNVLFSENKEAGKLVILMLNDTVERTEIVAAPVPVAKTQKQIDQTKANPDKKEDAKVVVKIDPKKTEPTPIPDPKKKLPKPQNFDAKLKTSGNSVSWNSDLKSAQSLRIKFTSKIDGKVLVNEDVTGLSEFYFSYRNSIYEASPITIQLTGTWENGSTIKNNTKTVSDLECH